MRGIVLIGGGGHCRSVLDSVLSLGRYDKIVISDPNLTRGDFVMGCPVIGGDEMLPVLREQGFTEAFVTIGSIKSTARRRSACRRAKALGFQFDNIIDPSAQVSRNCKLGTGVFVGKQAVINTGSEIGSFAIINTAAVVEHDCRVGDFTHVSIRAVLCGGACAGNDCFIGAGAIVIQERSIPDETVIGAGAIVISDIAKRRTVTGVYKE